MSTTVTNHFFILFFLYISGRDKYRMIIARIRPSRTAVVAPI